MSAQAMRAASLLGTWQNLKGTNLGLCSDAIGTIDPDVFGQNSASLVQFHVFHQLAMESDSRWCLRQGCGAHILRIGDGGRLSLCRMVSFLKFEPFRI